MLTNKSNNTIFNHEGVKNTQFMGLVSGKCGRVCLTIFNNKGISCGDRQLK